MKPIDNVIKSVENIEKTKISSEALNQYIAFKEDNPDSLVLMQIGAFFEALFEDAKILSDISGIALGTRQFKNIGRVIQAGVHINSVDFYIKQLLNNGYKVLLCSEFTDSDGNRTRKIKRKFTKGTIVENEFLDSFENNYILALFKDDFYYLAYADVSTGQFYKTKTIDYNELLSEVDKISPDEILLSRLQVDIFKDICLKYNISILSENYFSEGQPSDVIIKYCKNTQKEYVVKLNSASEYKINQFLLMDEMTRFNLELTRTKRFLRKKGSLFWFLNHTKTPMGSRLLKKYLNEPLISVQSINERQEAVKELLKNKNDFKNIDEYLSGVCDLSRICAKISNSTILPKDLFALVDNFKNIEFLNEILSKYSSSLIRLDIQKFLQMSEFIKLIRNAVKSDTSNDVQSGNIINDGFDPILDKMKAENQICDKNIFDYENSLKRKFKIESLSVKYSKQLGYFIEVPASLEHLFNFEFYKLKSPKTVSRFSSNKLRELETFKNDVQYKINQYEYDLFCQIRRKAILFIDATRHIAVDLARFDVLFSFAKCAKMYNFTCPAFNDKVFSVKNGFHPALAKSDIKIVKNDTLLKAGELYIITGANMGGKSTYLKHNAIIALLAQIGSFVPADFANVEICDKIFLRQGINDDLANNNSSFMVEMNDLKFILDNSTDKSFVLLDEPAKSTSGVEGGAIARAYLEFLMLNVKPKAIVVTHNTELTKIESKYPDFAQNWFINLSSDNSSRKLQRGCAGTSKAVDTAKLANLPDEVIELSKKYLLNG